MHSLEDARIVAVVPGIQWRDVVKIISRPSHGSRRVSASCCFRNTWHGCLAGRPDAGEPPPSLPAQSPLATPLPGVRFHWGSISITPRAQLIVPSEARGG